jgi:hypothetical protein
MDKHGFDKIKMPEIKQFARRHISETFTIAALIFGGLSAWKAFFFGGFLLTGLFFIVAAALGIFFPRQVDQGLKKFYQTFATKSRTSEIIIGVGTFVIAILFPWIFFGLMGFLTGSAYQYFTQITQSSGHKGSKAA